MNEFFLTLIPLDLHLVILHYKLYIEGWVLPAYKDKYVEGLGEKEQNAERVLLNCHVACIVDQLTQL